MEPTSGMSAVSNRRAQYPAQYLYAGSDKFSTSTTSPTRSMLSQTRPILYPRYPHYDYPAAPQSPEYLPRGPLSGPSFSASPPVWPQHHPFDSPSFSSESRPRTVESSSEGPHSPSSPSSTSSLRTSPPNSISSSSAPRSTPMTASVPSGFGHLLNPAPPLLPQPPTRSRLRLFVREQPQAARACGSGDRCRRPVDPIPIVQLLMTDFNPISEEDRRQLTSNQYIVSCQLLPVAEDSERSRKGRASARSNAENSFGRYGRGLGNSDVDQLIARQPGGNLSGGTYMSPFSADQDPDPSTAPSHPQSMTNLVTNSTAATLPRPPRRPPCTNICAPNPATFFVFSDLCVRTAGEYQLLFTLMNPFEAMQSKSSPILDEVRSETFEVFSAKDFRGMQRTPELARGLRRLGVQGIKLRDKTRESANGGAAQSVSEEDVDGGED